MHIRGNQANLNTINPYSAAADRAQAAARRAANLSKRLLKNAAALDGVEGLDEERLVGRWENPGQGRGQATDEYHGAEWKGDSGAS